jgi:hypothetical protein
MKCSVACLKTKQANDFYLPYSPTVVEPSPDPNDRCRWVPFACLFSMSAFERVVREKHPGHGQPAIDTAASASCHGVLPSPPITSNAHTSQSPPAANSLAEAPRVQNSTSASAAVASVAPAPVDIVNPAASSTAVTNASAVTAVAPPSLPSSTSQFISLSSVVLYLSSRYTLFVSPVNPKLFVGYNKIVKNPMSLSVITSKFVLGHASVCYMVDCFAEL